MTKSGTPEAAIVAHQRAVSRQPRNADAHFALAEVYRVNGKFDSAVHYYRSALVLAPAYFAAWVNLSAVLIEQSQFADAAAALRQALAIHPGSAEVHINLGLVAQKLEQLDAAAAYLRQALVLSPQSASAHYYLGDVLRQQGKPVEAIASLKAALAIEPDLAGAHNSLGLACWDEGRQDEAVASYLEAIRCDARCAAAFNNLGSLMLRQGQLEIAVDALREAIAIDPGYAMAYLNLSSVLREQGRFELAIDSCRTALALRPGWLEAQQALLLIMSSTATGDDPGNMAEVRALGQMADQRVAGRAFTAWQPRLPGARLKVGMVSGDLRAHPVAYFLEGILGHLSALGVDVVLYPTTSFQDGVSARLQQLCFAWNPICGLGDADAAARIHADGIDVLLDLAGHTHNNRLPVFGWRPAPLQVSWLGYFATTGLRQMDAVLVDRVGVPPQQAAAFTEQLCYLPDTRLCFSPPADAPPLSALPAAHKGQLTIGCFQQYAKVSDRQLLLWARVLDAVPGSLLRWQCIQFADPQCVEQTAARLVQSGIGIERVQLFGHVSRAHYLAAHAEVDLILDTSPYPGGTTTCEALWMGVPTVTLAGKTMLARQGASLLTAAGLADWVSDSEDAYVARAVAAARDLPGLAALRAGLRQQVAASPLCDGKRFATHLHAAFLELAAQK
jgi:protein O-GlcNAc transferase